MSEITIIEQTFYKPELSDTYDALMASLHMAESWEHDPQDIRAVCESKTSSHFHAILGGSVVAMATLGQPVDAIGHRTSVIEDVAVLPDARGKGVGASMLQFLEHRAYSLGANRIELHSKDEREDAQRMYRKANYEMINTRLFRKVLSDLVR